MAYFQDPQVDPGQEQDQEPESNQGFTIEELGSTPEGKKALLEAGISEQAGRNVREQDWGAKFTVGQSSKPKYVPAPIWGAGRQIIGDLTRIGGAVAGGHPLVESGDPLSKIATAGRYGSGRKLSIFGDEGSQLMFGAEPGSAESGGAEVAKFLEAFTPGGGIKTAVAKTPSYLQGPVRVMLEAANAAGQAKLHGQDPVMAGSIAALPPVIGRIIAPTTQEVAPGVSDWAEKQGRNWYGGIFNPKSMHEKAVAAQAIDPLIEHQKTYFGGKFRPLGKGIYATRGQVAREAEKKVGGFVREQAEAINRRGGHDFPMNYTDFESDIQNAINTKLKVTNKATGASSYRGAEAENVARHLEDLLARARVVSEPGPAGTRTIPYQALMGFKSEADDALAAAGVFHEHRGEDLATQVANRAKRIGSGAARAETERTAKEIYDIDRQISRWVNVQEGVEKGELKQFGRTGSEAKPIVSAVGGQAMAERAITYAQYKAAISTWEKIKQSPLMRTSIGKGILINMGRALKRGDMDGFAALVGRTAARYVPEAVPFPKMEEGPYTVKESYDYDPNSGGLIPRTPKK